MEPSGVEAVPKAANKKKKKKKKQKKTAAAAAGSGSSTSGREATDGRLTAAELLPLLKQQLEDAKAAKDYDLAGTLRLQLWVVTDLANGIKTDMEEEDYTQIVASLPLSSRATWLAPTEEVKAFGGQGSGGGGGASSSGSSTENRVRTLRKKLDQIGELKVKQAKGVTLELNQIEKIKNEHVVRQELADLESLLKELHVTVA